MIKAGAIVDASVAVKWVVQEAGSDSARLLSQARLEAPDLLPIECANILWKKVRLGDLTRRDAADRFGNLQQAPVTLSSTRTLLGPALELAFEFQHPVYDCVYLALAIERHFPLVTADEKLVNIVRTRRKTSNLVMLLSEVQS